MHPIQTTIALIFGDLMKEAILIVVGIVLVFLYSNFIGFILLLIFPLFFIAVIFNTNKVKKYQLELMEANSKKTSYYVNSIQGIEVIKSFNKEKEFSTLNKLIFDFFQDKNFQLGKLGISLQILFDSIKTITNISILFACSTLVLKKELSIGELIAITFLVNTILPSVCNLSLAHIRVEGAKIAFDRMYEFISIFPEYESNKSSTDSIDFNCLTLDKITFRFPGKKPLIDNISIEVKKGQIISIIGESGGGKTTLINILLRFYSIDSGNFLLNNKSVNDFDIFNYRNNIGYIPQDVPLFNGNLLENICFSSSIHDLQQAQNFCINYGLDKYFREFPNYYSTMLGEGGISLSGGQKQLIGLARALYKNPKLLILDEPTSAMDRHTENFSISLLEKIKQNCGIIIVTHRMKFCRFADNIYILENGKINAQGSHSQLMEYDNFYSIGYKELIF